MAMYRFYEDHNNNRVICVSSYAGKPVRASAKCFPGDEYSFEKGADLASVRVDVKVSEKRVKRAERKLKEALKMLDEAQAYVDRMEDYLVDAQAERDTAYANLARLEENL